MIDMIADFSDEPCWGEDQARRQEIDLIELYTSLSSLRPLVKSLAEARFDRRESA